MTEYEQLGWSSALQPQWNSVQETHPGTELGRVAIVERGGWVVIGSGWRALASCAGRMVHESSAAMELPAVGDWVAVTRDGDRGRIEALLPRTSAFVRKAAGDDIGQVVATNLDVVFVVTAVGADFNPRRVERYVAAVLASGARPVVVINKCDLPYDPMALILALDGAAPEVPIAFVSAERDDALGELAKHLVPGETIALVGSSGVGKSTLVNRLLGAAVQSTGPVRGTDDKGRHTTTRRELHVSPDGVVVIDTPGMRELGLFDANEGVSEAFADIECLNAACRFNDCTHGDEPGCAIVAAVESGELTPERFASYTKLQREAEYERTRTDARAARNAQTRWKAVTKSMRHRNKLAQKHGGKLVK